MQSNVAAWSIEILIDTSQWLYILPLGASVYVTIAVFSRWRELQKSCIKVNVSHRGNTKVLLNLALLIFQSCVVGWSLNVSLQHGNTISEVIHLVAIASITFLSPREHYRSLRPSKLMAVYLSIRTIADAFTLLFTLGTWSALALALKTFLEAANLIAESQSKESILLDNFRDVSPEEKAGPWSQGVFWWINSALFARQKAGFSLETLPKNPRQLDPSRLRQRLSLAWDQRKTPTTQFTLPLALLQCLMPEFVTIVPTRLLLIVLRYAQPLLISKILQLLAANSLGGRSYQLSCSIIMVSTIVYIGQAIVSSRYEHQLNRLNVMTRAALIGLIYEKTLNTPYTTYKDFSAVTLMSTDADSLGNVSDMFHEAWSQVLEVGVGVTLLAQQIGWFCLVPLLLISGCSNMTRYVAKNLRPKQHAWNKATQDRINKVVSILSSIKIVKMLGMTEVVKSQISDSRRVEIDASKDMRWVSVLANASANALGLFTPPITVILFAAFGKSKLDAETAYTTLAILVMVTHPANMVMTIVPRAIASLASFQRIQDFISKPHYQDLRLRLRQGEGATLDDCSRAPQPAIELKNVDFRLADATNAVLENISLRIDQGSIVICTGPTGVGKSVLALAVAGEVTPSKGSISVITKFTALCVQSAWLSGQSVSDMVRGFSSSSVSHDEGWYRQVLEACCIDREILLDSSTSSGSGHARLSGGQKQRIALARAVYQRCDNLVLDDPFSALDQRTQDRVIVNLLSPDGLLRHMHTTVFLITNAARAYPLADRILLLEQRSIKFDGDWSEYLAQSGSLTSYTHKHDGIQAEVDENKQPAVVRNQKQQVIKDDEFDLDRRPGDAAVYGYYLRSVGAFNMIALLSCTALYSFFSIFPQYWLKWWTESKTASDTFYMLGYLVLSMVAWASTSTMLWVNFMKLAPRSGAVLHARLLGTVLGAPMSYFLNNDIGTIVNRFSQDIQLIDRDLPSALAALCTQIFKLVMQCSLLLTSQKLLVFALPIYAIFIYIVQKVYLRTSRQIRYLELESRSAVYSRFLETVEGITTIRSSNQQQTYLSRTTQNLDLSQRAFYLFLCLQRWLNIILDLAIAIVAILVITLAVFFTSETSSADVGIALNMVLVANTTLLRLVENWTRMETSVGAAARLKELEDFVPREEDCAVETFVPKDWPSAGALVLRDLRVGYGSRAVLSNINLTIHAGQKVFICGETGSGKSTLLTAFLRLSTIHHGSIILDNIDITHLSPSLLRSRCFITIPQDAFFQPDISLRDNLDPGNHHSDIEIMTALEKLQLWSHFLDTVSSSFHDDEGAGQVLVLPLSSFPPLSVGHSQLLSLTRALLHSSHHARLNRKPMILLDEPAANLDAEFEDLCSKIIQEEFTEKGFTVCMITHSVKDLRQRVRRGKDVVVRVRDGGVEVVEFEMGKEAVMVG
ncbi:hypothetical protein M438DRAFT_317897 [Aureobasidium pullulans EXF-150]|uniref:Multidrug resistance protein n=1 Tax=Aureobasidium pullulans EXF-150 TaxID=1043002 RepID=A0A074XHF3_AURPU|nr:uncharacterized protein M438DRAFT_317897 [Aureobasidium pullulans EXF-150]KEQ84925.1 hypothetical protein M438DRAFT_317897 [Aureobasidium pullulans EXF-150]